MPRLIAAFFILAAGLSAQPKIEFEYYQLPNGMQVILHPDHRLGDPGKIGAIEDMVTVK